jgi:hypothetical protein
MSSLEQIQCSHPGPLSPSIPTISEFAPEPSVIAVLFVSLLALPFLAQNASLIVPQQSKYCYPWTVLGSDRNA